MLNIFLDASVKIKLIKKYHQIIWKLAHQDPIADSLETSIIALLICKWKNSLREIWYKNVTIQTSKKTFVVFLFLTPHLIHKYFIYLQIISFRCMKYHLSKNVEKNLYPFFFCLYFKFRFALHQKKVTKIKFKKMSQGKNK